MIENRRGKKIDIFRNKSGVPGKNKKAGEEFIKKNMRNLLDWRMNPF